MDNLTHTLTGLMLARTGIGSRVPLGALLMMAAANAPDLDVVSAVYGSHVYLDHHRGITHALAASPVAAALCTVAVGAWKRQAFPWLRAWLAAWIAVLSHLLWDWTNIYGIRLLEPFSSAWLRLDLVSVVDPLIWAVLLMGLLWPLLAGLVSQEIGDRSRYGRGSALAALLLVFAYVGVRATLHARAVAVLESRVYEEGTPARVAAFPDVFNPMRWGTLIEFPHAFRISQVSLAEEFDPSAGRVLYRSQGQHKAARVAAQTAPFQAFLRFSAFPFWMVSSTHAADYSGFRVEANDLRFGLPGEGRFTAVVVVDEQFKTVENFFQFSPRGQLPRPR